MLARYFHLDIRKYDAKGAIKLIPVNFPIASPSTLFPAKAAILKA